MRGVGWAVAMAVLGSACARNHAPPQTIAPRYEGPIQSRDVVEGGRIYITLCTACHRGRVNPRGYTWSAGQMRHQIREGNRLMPPLSDELLSDSQVEAVLAYLKVMGALEGDLPPVPANDDGLDLDEEEMEALAEATEEAEAAAASGEDTSTAVLPPALEPEDPWDETGGSLASPTGTGTQPEPTAPPPITDGTTVGTTVLKAEAMIFVLSNMSDGSATRLRIRVQPETSVAIAFGALRVDGTSVGASRWRAGEGAWIEGDQPLQVDAATTLEIQLEQPVRGTGGSLEAALTVGGQQVVLPVPTHASHETVEPY